MVPIKLNTIIVDPFGIEGIVAPINRAVRSIKEESAAIKNATPIKATSTPNIFATDVERPRNRTERLLTPIVRVNIQVGTSVITKTIPESAPKILPAS